MRIRFCGVLPEQLGDRETWAASEYHVWPDLGASLGSTAVALSTAVGRVQAAVGQLDRTSTELAVDGLATAGELLVTRLGEARRLVAHVEDRLAAWRFRLVGAAELLTRTFGPENELTEGEGPISDQMLYDPQLYSRIRGQLRDAADARWRLCRESLASAAVVAAARQITAGRPLSSGEAARLRALLSPGGT